MEKRKQNMYIYIQGKNLAEIKMQPLLLSPKIYTLSEHDNTRIELLMIYNSLCMVPSRCSVFVK